MAIVSGRLSPGQRLPSTRALADEWQVSRYPVFSAFEQLLREGYVEGKAGSGTFVRQHISDELARPVGARRPASRPVGSGTNDAVNERKADRGSIAWRETRTLR